MTALKLDPRIQVSYEIPLTGLRRNTAINESKIEYVELNANPIRGCSHACKYCYARKIDVRFGKVKSTAEWHKPKVFENFFDVLEKEISRGKINPDREIFLSTMTDLYQPYALKYNIGRKLLLRLQKANLTYRLLTKSPDVIDDIDLLQYSKGKVGLSITTDSTNEKQRKHWEPKTISIQDRLEALKELDLYGGINVWVSAEPFLPGTNFENYYKDIFAYAGDSLTELVIGKMNYESGVDQQFDWEEVINITEKYRAEYGKKVRFHYKKEFWHFLQKKKLTPVDLGLAPKKDFDYLDKL